MSGYDGVLDNVLVSWRGEGDGGDLVVTFSTNLIRVTHECDERPPHPSLALCGADWETVMRMIKAARRSYEAAGRANELAEDRGAGA